MAINRQYTRPDTDGQLPLSSRQPPSRGHQVQHTQRRRPPVAWGQSQARQNPRPYVTPEEEKANRLVREAEQAKLQLYDVPGRNFQNFPNVRSNFVERGEPISAMDNDYLMVAAHVDENTQAKIAAGEYVDFSKLVPKDRLIQEEDQRLQMVSRDGQTYLVPAGKDQNIISFNKWEQDFRVYANIYLRYNSHTAPELIEYN